MKNWKRKILSILLSLVLAAGLIPTVQAVSTTFDVDLTIPKIGQTVGSVPVPETDAPIIIMDSAWTIYGSEDPMEENDRFEKGKTYCLYMDIRPEDENPVWDQLSITINGQATVYDEDTECYVYTLTFDADKAITGTAVVTGDLVPDGKAACTLRGLPNDAIPQYQWQLYARSGWKDIYGATKTNLSLENYNGGDQIRCVVTAEDYTGQVISKSVTITEIPEVNEVYSLKTQVRGGHGTISNGADDLTAGERCTVIFRPDTGYEIDRVTINGVEVNIKSNSLSVVMNSDKTVVVTYKVIVTDFTITTRVAGGHGTLTADKSVAKQGEIIELEASAARDYQVNSITARDANGQNVTITQTGRGITFIMPDTSVIVTATFVLVNDVPGTFFIDVKDGDYFKDAVLWAVDKKVTSGTSATTFGPNSPCTRGQAVTFLWRANGSPTVSGANPFTDVKSSDYFYQAVLWAVEKGITNGTGPTTFSPNASCTRGQIVTFLHRSAGSPAAAGTVMSDVPATAYFAAPVRWAVSKGITNGTSPTTFSPDNTCTRGQIVTFIYRQLGK